MSKIIFFIKNWRNYKKAIIGFVLAAAAWASASLADGTISLAEWLALIPVFFTGPGVYVATNEPSNPPDVPSVPLTPQ